MEAAPSWSSPVQSPVHSPDAHAASPAALPLQWRAGPAASIVLKAKPNATLDDGALAAVSATCSQLVVTCAAHALAATPPGGAASLASVERSVCTLFWRRRSKAAVPPEGSLVRRGHVQAHEMAAMCAGAAALQPAVARSLVAEARCTHLAKGGKCCEGCSDAAIAYLGAMADFICSELLAAAVSQAEQECSRHVFAAHLSSALRADRQLAEACSQCFGCLSVEAQAIPFCCARFGTYDVTALPLRDCPTVVFEDDEELAEGLFGAVAVVVLSENPDCSFASRAQQAQTAGAIALILICSDDELFEPSCRASESEGLTIPVAIVARCDRPLFADNKTVSLSLNAHGEALYCADTRRAQAAAAVREQPSSADVAAAATAPAPAPAPEAWGESSAGRRSTKRTTAASAGGVTSGDGGLDLEEAISRLGGKRSKQSSAEPWADSATPAASGFSLPSLAPM